MEGYLDIGYIWYFIAFSGYLDNTDIKKSIVVPPEVWGKIFRGCQLIYLWGKKLKSPKI